MPDMVWNGDGVAARVAAAVRAVLMEAAEEVFLPELKRVLSYQGPPPSLPYMPPHMRHEDDRTAEMAKGIRHLVDSVRIWRSGDAVQIGADNRYGLYLEIGTSKMPMRPWLVPTLTRADLLERFNAAVGRRLASLLGGGAPSVAASTVATPPALPPSGSSPLVSGP